MPEPVVQDPPAAGLPPVDLKLVQAQAEVAEARRIADQLTRQLGQQRQQAPLSNQPSIDDLNKQFYKEPVQSTVAIVNQGIADALRQHGQAGFDTLIEVAKDKVRTKNPELFEKYKSEIEMTVSSTVDKQFHTNINVWDNAANIVYGSHMSEIRDMARQNDPTKQTPAIRVSEGGPSTAGSHQGALPKGEASKLSTEELKMARDLDITPEAYQEGKTAYENQSTRGKSSWDGLVTFSSKDARRVERAKRRAAAAK